MTGVLLVITRKDLDGGFEIEPMTIYDRYWVAFKLYAQVIRDAMSELGVEETYTICRRFLSNLIPSERFGSHDPNCPPSPPLAYQTVLAISRVVLAALFRYSYPVSSMSSGEVSTPC